MNQSEYISHNLNAHDDDKVVALIDTHTATGYGVYWVIIERMGTEPELRLADKPHVYISLARKCNVPVDTVKAVVESCIEFELFLRDDDGFFYSQSLRDRMKLREEAYDKKRRAGKNGAEKRWHNHSDAIDTHHSAIAEPSSAMAEDGTECQIERENREVKGESEIENEKRESVSAPARVGGSKKNEDAQAALKFKPPKNSIRNPGAGPPKKSSAHLFKDSPYCDLDGFKAAPLFNTAAFKANYPNIDLEYYFRQLARFATSDPPPKKSDWLVYVEGWMSEEKTNNKLRTLKRHGANSQTSNHGSAAGQRNRTALTTPVGGSNRTAKADSF